MEMCNFACSCLNVLFLLNKLPSFLAVCCCHLEMQLHKRILIHHSNNISWKIRVVCFSSIPLRFFFPCGIILALNFNRTLIVALVSGLENGQNPTFWLFSMQKVRIVPSILGCICTVISSNCFIWWGKSLDRQWGHLFFPCFCVRLDLPCSTFQPQSPFLAKSAKRVQVLSSYWAKSFKCIQGFSAGSRLSSLSSPEHLSCIYLPITHPSSLLHWECRGEKDSADSISGWHCWIPNESNNCWNTVTVKNSVFPSGVF